MISFVKKNHPFIHVASSLLLFGISVSNAQVISPPKNNFQVSFYHVFSDSAHSIALPDSFIIAGSDSVALHGRHLQRFRDYQLDYLHSQLLFPDLQFQTGDSIFIAYQRLLLPLNKTYRLLIPRGKNDSLQTNRPHSPALLPQIAHASEGYTADLRKSGSLVRGLSLGSNQGLKVDSGLRLQVNGEVAPGVELVAALTDQNTPIQPEGNTQTLQEIDKVFIQLKSKQFETTLGDYELNFAGTEFTRYQRKLQGAMATVFPGEKSRITLSGAVSKGKYRTQRFQGIEGNQGPYQLTGDRGQIDILVLAGTERVWLDGTPMVRGENNDYVMEYGNGEILFTRKRLITADSRIIVDFQYSDEQFQRSLYGLQAGTRLLSDKLQLRTTLLREKDDAGNPLGLSLTEDIRAALRNAGDSRALVEGAAFVGADKGSYVLQDSVYVFVGINSGDYQVRFSDLGPGEGSYNYQGFGNYIFVGAGAGRYAPVVLLPRARKHDIADIRLDFQAAKTVKISAEWALSNLDENLYSAKDDEDNNGHAYYLTLQAAPESMKLRGWNLGKGSLQIKRRFRAKKYRDIDRADEIEFRRRWDINTAGRGGDEIISETQLQYAPVPSVQFFATAGLLEKPGYGLKSKKITASTNWRTPRFVELDYRVERIKKTETKRTEANDWLRQKGDIRRRFGFLQPMFAFENEVKKEQPLADSLRSGFRFTELIAGLGLVKLNKLTAEIQFAQREDDDRFAGAFQRLSVAKTSRFNLASKNIRRFHFSASYIHRRRNYAAESTPDSRTNLAEIKIGSNHWRKALRLDAQYRISNTQVGRQERVYFKVKDGEGNYRYEATLDEYISDPFGDYILRLLPTDEFIPVVELKSRFNIRFDPHKAFGRKKKKRSFLTKILRNIGSETFLRIDEKTQETDVRQIYLLNLAQFQKPATTLFGAMELRQDITLFGKRRDFSLRYRLISSKNINNQFLNDEQKRWQIRHEWRLNINPARKLSGRFEIIRSIEDKTFARDSRPDRFIRGLRFIADLSFRPKNQFELALRSVFGSDIDKAYSPATKVQQLTFKPRTTYSFHGRGRLRADFELTDVSANESSRIIPYELAQGNRLGKSFRWNIAFEYRMSTNLNTSVSYQGRQEPQRESTIHLAKVELRAYF